MKKVFVRFYDKENLGDDLFLRILMERFSDQFSIRRSYNAGEFTPSGKLRIVRETRTISYLDKVASRLTRTRMLFSIHQISRSDLLIYIGGSLFMDNTSIAYWLRESRFYKMIKVPYFILGSNVGPVRTRQFLGIVADIFRGAQDVCLRDRASGELFKDVPSVRVATDIAFTLDTKAFSRLKQNREVVFSVIDAYKKFDEKIAEKYEKEIISLAEKFTKEGYQVTLMSFCKYEGDEDTISRITRKMNEKLRQQADIYMYRGNLDEALTVLAKSEIVVASRFHAAILGLLFGKKVLPMAYSDKTTNILKDMSFDGPVIDIRKIDKFDGSVFDFGVLQTYDVSKQIELAEKQFQELDKVLTKKNVKSK